MSRLANPLLLFIPEQMIGQILVLMLMAGGIAMIVGARRTGIALVVTAIAIPFISLFAEALMEALFAALPDALVMPLAWAIIGAGWIAMIWVLIKTLVGQRAVDAAKGQLLADAVKGLMRLAFRPKLLLIAGSVLFGSWIAS